MNFLRSAPFLPFASALQVFIFSCCGEAAVGAPSVAGGLPERHSFMKLLRSGPFNACVLASALQVFIFSCCAVSAKPGPAASVIAEAIRISVFFMGELLVILLIKVAAE
jgi:hypothetical protein